MGGATRVDCASLMMAGVIVAGIAWMIDRPDSFVWSIRIGGAVTAILGFGLFLMVCLRRDIANDYLRSVTRTYYNRDGFCFAPVVMIEGGTAWMKVYFQSQYDKPTVARVALRPARGIFMTRAPIDPMEFEVECPPAGFGVARIPFPIPRELQGRHQSFEIGASIQYPEGKGLRIRFNEGVLLRTNADFGNTFGTVLSLAAIWAGFLVFSRPTATRMQLPVGVAKYLPQADEPEVIMMWQLGDPKLDWVAS